MGVVRPLALLLLVAACKTAPPEKPPPSPAPPPSPSPEFSEAQWRAEAEKVFFRKHMQLARLYRDGLEIDKALEQVNQALLLKPTAEDAIKLRAELQRLSGERAGEVGTLLEDEWQSRLAREEEREVAARRYLAEAREAEAAGDYERAAEAYQRAIFVAREE
jgi:tetratricopeptide (TPR) repeat protein